MSVHPFVRRSDEGEAYWFLGNLVTVKATGAQTGGRLTAVEFVNPPGFAPPLHRHQVEDEMFYLLSGTATFHCGEAVLTAVPGDFVLLPAGLPHTFVVGPDEPLRVLQLTTPAGFEEYVADVGVPALERRLPDPAPIDPAALGHASARHGIELLGPPPGQQPTGHAGQPTHRPVP
ncbi:quercetin 2,3-dioxygenase [Verrucosispora sp. WMMD573]|uniref:quercetin 2,3-dioxygenase n=1 Tax=Verrucosispora sp. WMMD573 TaxID=3015149 RepID=UPI00248B34DE|nr:quercetin 2,3-dioxygenase [Verrucosispora sp. WMMD573]WBB54289.1 quercetin 2,3-dioxygenase [Verrucosispora sp. WMMD573]